MMLSITSTIKELLKLPAYLQTLRNVMSAPVPCALILLDRESLERRAGIEPANTGFADPRVSHFATGALRAITG